jgi:hypothetical protein
MSSKLLERLMLALLILGVLSIFVPRAHHTIEVTMTKFEALP